MSRTINKVILLGRLGADPQIKYISNGNAVLNVRIATDRFREGVQEDPDWHNVVLWGRDAELVAQHARKGYRLSVIGRIQQNSWSAEDGTKRYKTEVHASEVGLIDFYQTGNAPEESSQEGQLEMAGAAADTPF